ncbi:MAG: GMC family oxidoreductase [Deltaproteobacteria bacterium]|nr:GMC family oxidoreductase [Deltaproteobacteria bacterium]
MPVLTRRERLTLTAFAEAILDVPSPTLPFSIEALALADRVDEQLAALSRDGRWIYRCFLWILEYSAIGYYRAPFHRFTRMSLTNRRRYLEAWRRSPWSPKRLLRRFLEALILMNYYADPRVSAACGFTPEFGRRPRTVLASERLWRRPPATRVDASVEILIIGSGAGGAVAAETLARRGHEVVILEEGDVPQPGDFGDTMRFIRRYYRHGGVTATYGWPTILVPVGRVVGGTTVVNSGTCLRAQGRVFDRWAAEFGLAGLGPAIRARYADIERMLTVMPTPDALQGPHARLVAAGAVRLGFSARPLPRNAGDCHGSGVCCFGCPTDAKMSMALTYLPAALTHGARLYANATVTRLHWSGDRIRRVTGTFHDPETRAAIGAFTFRPKIVILAAGAMGTPILLCRSGVPDPGGHLGRHLTLHPATKVIAEFDQPVRAWQGVPQGLVIEDLASEGILMESIFTPPAQIAMSLLVDEAAHRRVMERYNHLAAFGFMVSDASEGRICTPPGMGSFAYYRLRGPDLRRFVRGLKVVTEIFFAAGARVVYPSVYPLPVIDRATGSAVFDRVRIHRKDLDLQAWHPLGTCRMAADPRHGVIDPEGRLFGLANCYVADGSIFPTALGVNPQLTIMAAAQTIADGIAAQQHSTCRSPTPRSFVEKMK